MYDDPGVLRAGSSSVGPSSEGEEDEEEPRAYWNSEEDSELKKLVKKDGVGDWVGKATRFSSARSANSLRKRWAKLEDDEIDSAALSTQHATSPSEAQERVKVWNTRTRRALAGMSAQNLTLRPASIGLDSVNAWHVSVHHNKLTETPLPFVCIGAPRRENLQRYLSDHPEMVIYDGQDQGDEFSVSAHPEDSEPVREDRKRTFWTDAEDEELANLVAKRENPDPSACEHLKPLVECFHFTVRLLVRNACRWQRKSSYRLDCRRGRLFNWTICKRSSQAVVRE